MTDQLGGLVCYQADYDNDGRWTSSFARGMVRLPIRPSLLRNNGAAASSTSPTMPACSTRSTPTRPPGPITTMTAGSTFSSAASTSPTVSITTREMARSRRSRPRLVWAIPALLQGMHLDRLRQRRLSRPLPQQPGRDCRLYHNNRNGTFTDVTGLWGSTGPTRVFRAGHGISTTTVGSTSSPPPTNAP